MLSITPQDLQPQPYYYLPFRSTPVAAHPTRPQQQQHHQHQHQHHQHQHHQQPELPYFAFANIDTPPASIETINMAPSKDVAQALEIARESPDGSADPTISKILEGALSQIWGKVQAQPESYVMTRDEFAVFNFFQHRFTGDKTAVSARKRYWDNARA